MQNTRALDLSVLRYLWRLPAATVRLPFQNSDKARASSERIHAAVLGMRGIPAADSVFRGIYALAERVFLRSCRNVNRTLGRPVIRSVYLRRGGGRGELVPGASDLDFFLVLEELSAEEEMRFLKEFWSRFRYWKKYFPFLGETLMGDRNELANWLHTPTVRSFEAAYSWKLLSGHDELGSLDRAARPLLRDVFSECAKCYWAVLHPIVREENLELRADDPRALKFRNGAKSALDLFRMHYSFARGLARDSFARGLARDSFARGLARDSFARGLARGSFARGLARDSFARDLDQLWGASRRELATLLPAEIYGEELPKLVPLLELSGELPRGEALFTLFAGIVHRAFLCLDEIAVALEAGAASEEGGLREFRPLASGTKVLQSGNKIGKDHYSLSVREVFAERMILRNRDCLRRTLVSDTTSHMVFPFFANPSREAFTRVLHDLRVASTSFNKASVALPLSEATLRELERSSFLDSPFHAFYEHQETRLGEDGQVYSSAYVARSHSLPANILAKTFAEVSLAIRFQPPPDFVYLVENLVALVLQLRVAEEFGEIATDFYSALARYSERHPLRANYLKDQMGKYLNLCNEDEDRFWTEVLRLNEELGVKHPHRASLVRAQLETLKSRKYDADWKLQLATTDLWVELAPFLRLEMNSLRDRYFPEKSLLKL